MDSFYTIFAASHILGFSVPQVIQITTERGTSDWAQSFRCAGVLRTAILTVLDSDIITTVAPITNAIIIIVIDIMVIFYRRYHRWHHWHDDD